MASNIWMYRDGETKLIFFPVEVVEVVSPEIFDITRVHPAMGVGRLFDEHHRRKVIQVPVGGYLHERGLRARLEGYHPCLRMFAVVYLGP
jgi:hypothetical protein